LVSPIVCQSISHSIIQSFNQSFVNSFAALVWIDQAVVHRSQISRSLNLRLLHIPIYPNSTPKKKTSTTKTISTTTTIRQQVLVLHCGSSSESKPLLIIRPSWPRADPYLVISLQGGGSLVRTDIFSLPLHSPQSTLFPAPEGHGHFTTLLRTDV
jgi:hypothetical protein